MLLRMLAAVQEGLLPVLQSIELIGGLLSEDYFGQESGGKKESD